MRDNSKLASSVLPTAFRAIYQGRDCIRITVYVALLISIYWEISRWVRGLEKRTVTFGEPSASTKHPPKMMPCEALESIRVEMELDPTHTWYYRERGWSYPTTSVPMN